MPRLQLRPVVHPESVTMSRQVIVGRFLLFCDGGQGMLSRRDGAMAAQSDISRSSPSLSPWIRVEHELLRIGLAVGIGILGSVRCSPLEFTLY